MWFMAAPNEALLLIMSVSKKSANDALFGFLEQQVNCMVKFC